MRRTSQQQTFIDELSKGSSSIILSAVAGSGKTTTLVEACNEVKAEGLACAFNVRIKEELAARLPTSMVTKTMNGLGHQAWARHLNNTKLSLNERKIYNCIDKHLKFKEAQGLGDLKKLIDLARAFGLVPSRAPGGPQQDDLESWNTIIDSYDLDIGSISESYLIDIARTVLTSAIKEGWKGNIDFADQLYLPVVYNAPFTKFPLVLVDEAQDLSIMQHEMLRRLLAPDGTLVAVGDPHQAIYGFRGAHTNSMDFLADKFHAIKLPLTVSFRCPKEIVKEAKHYVPEIESSEDAPDGLVGRSSIKDILPGDTVLCFYNKPLAEVAFSLIRAGIGAKIIGRDLCSGLKRIVLARLEVSQARSLTSLLSELRSWRDEQVAKFLSRSKDAKAESIMDRTEVIFIIAQELGVGAGPDDLLAAIDRLFSPAGPGIVTLSTIHKAKGLEWQRVHFIGKELLPPKWASKDWEIDQAKNACYVGVTRAKEELNYMDGGRK